MQLVINLEWLYKLVGPTKYCKIVGHNWTSPVYDDKESKIIKSCRVCFDICELDENEEWQNTTEKWEFFFYNDWLELKDAISGRNKELFESLKFI